MPRKTVKYLNILRDEFKVKSEELSYQADELDGVFFELCQLTVDDIRYGTETTDKIKAGRRAIAKLSRELTSFENAVNTYKEFF